MAKKRTKVAAIDVGTTKVCTIMADTDGDGPPRILGVGIVPSAGLHKGMVVNANEAKASIRASVRKAESIAGYKLESAAVGVTGRHVSSVNNKGVIAITRTDKLVRPSDLKRVLNVARTVKVPDEQELLHVIPRTFAVDGQDGVKNPVGMHGFRLDVETHIITAGVTSVQNLVKCIRAIGIDIDELVLEPLASAEAVLTEEEKEKGVMLADIGGGTTDIAVFKDNTIYHTSVLPVAGYQITRDISVGLNIPFELAESMKKKYGNLLLVNDSKSSRNNRDNNDDRTLTEDGHSVSYRDLSEILHVRLEELLRLIILELPRSDYAKLIPSGLVLCGGSSNLPGIAELGQEATRMPVRVGRPIGLSGVSDALNDPAYATSVGLLLWKKRNEGVQTWQPQSNIRRLLTKMFGFFR